MGEQADDDTFDLDSDVEWAPPGAKPRLRPPLPTHAAGSTGHKPWNEPYPQIPDLLADLVRLATAAHRRKHGDLVLGSWRGSSRNTKYPYAGLSCMMLNTHAARKLWAEMVEPTGCLYQARAPPQKTEGAAPPAKLGNPVSAVARWLLPPGPGPGDTPSPSHARVWLHA